MTNLQQQERFAKANTFKNLYRQIGDNISNIESLKNQNYGDWKFEDYTHDKKTNFKAVVLKNDVTKEIAVFNIGTDFKNPKDILTDIQMAFGKPTKQMKKANEYHRKISEKYRPLGYKMNSIGHSEGGSESQFVGINNPATDVYTINAYPIGRIKAAKESPNKGANVYNFRDPYDPVSKLGKSFGNDFIVPISDDTKRKPFIFGYKEAHQVKNMGDINNALTPVEYKKRKDSLGFLDNLDNVILTGEDIGKMDRFTFRAYEPLINQLLKEGSVMPRTEADYRVALGDLIYVNGYTRSDGVQVSGYYRRAAA